MNRCDHASLEDRAVMPLTRIAWIHELGLKRDRLNLLHGETEFNSTLLCMPGHLDGRHHAARD